MGGTQGRGRSGRTETHDVSLQTMIDLLAATPTA